LDRTIDCCPKIFSGSNRSNSDTPGPSFRLPEAALQTSHLGLVRRQYASLRAQRSPAIHRPWQQQGPVPCGLLISVQLSKMSRVHELDALPAPLSSVRSAELSEMTKSQRSAQTEGMEMRSANPASGDVRNTDFATGVAPRKCQIAPGN
jgi:hypothetical protein